MYVLSYENSIEEKSNILLIVPVPNVKGFSGLHLKPGKTLYLCLWKSVPGMYAKS